MRKKLLTTDSTLCGYIIMPVVCTLYGYQDSALNHMTSEYMSIVNMLIPLQHQSVEHTIPNCILDQG